MTNEAGTRKCLNCGGMFTVMGARRYCSDECAREALDRRRPARRLPAYRTCPVCKRTFVPLVANHKYCTQHCAVTARTVAYIRAEMARQPQGDIFAMDRSDRPHE